MPIHSRRGTGHGSGPRAARVFRVAENTSHQVLCLSDRLGGCFTHHVKRTEYCWNRDDCQYCRKHLEQFWKGYLAVHRWDTEVNLWQPEVLEVTEALELDMRGRYQRGQVWRLSRGPDTKTHSRVVGELRETRDPDSVAAAFDVLPVLAVVWHVPCPILDVRNPLPARIMVQAVEGIPPADCRPGERDARMTGAELQAAREKRAAMGLGHPLQNGKKEVGS